MKFDTNKIFNISNKYEFENLCIKIFKYQYENNDVYKKYIKFLKISADSIKKIDDIPFLPIDFFKNHDIISGNKKIDVTFKSSGTTGINTGRHHVTDIKLYEKSFFNTFEIFYGKIKYCILALLPSYLERNDSSLIYMTNKLISKNGSKDSGFYLNNFDDLYKKLLELENKEQKTILLGVSFALVDFFEKYKMQLKNTIIMETGGMKGRKKEPVKEELHNFLKKTSGVKNIHSEYGMTELLSQAYSKGDNIFETPPYMKVLIRDIYDPFKYLEHGKTGGINIIDLNNVNSCSFIETKDIGKINKNNNFEILGRFDQSDIRGCNLLVFSG